MAITPTYSWPTPDDTDLVKDGAEAIRDLALAIESTVSALGSKRIEAFTASGTWTVPAGVTYAIAHIRGGGAGSGGRTSSTNIIGGDGGSSSVAFAGGTVTATGGLGVRNGSDDSLFTIAGTNSQANSGAGGGRILSSGNARSTNIEETGNGTFIVAGDSVTPAASITVTVGAGGTGGGATTKGGDGGSGYVFIEYYE
jgi:hypothetical protein